jgi:endoglycosylceramidase
MRPLAFLALLAALCPRCDSGPPPGRTCTISPPSPADWRLVASGTNLRDSQGRVVSLRGVNAGGRSKFAPYVPFDFTDYPSALNAYMDRAASWGIDVLRVPFTWAALEPVQGQDDQSWLALYDQFLDAAWARGIWTIIDFHQDVYSEVYCGDGFPGWTVSNPPAPHHDCPQWGLEYLNDPGVQGAFDAFWANGSAVMTAYQAAWDVMVARYKDKPGVLGFEPINEPGWGTQDEGVFTASTLTAFYSVMIPRMRAAAPMSLVFIDATGLDGGLLTTQLNKPTGEGWVFAPHFYPFTHNPDGVADLMGNWVKMGAAWNVPVFLGEMGESDLVGGATEYIAAHFAAFDALPLVGGAVWEYSVAKDLWNSETNTVVAPDGTELAVAQALMRPFARAVAGDVATQTFDTTTTTFSLTYAPSASATTNVTSVDFPKRVYPTGAHVSLTGGCYDDTSQPGQILVRADTGATTVSLTISP